MDSQRPEINIKTTSMQTVTIILLSLSELNAFNPGDFQQRYHLFRALFNEIAQYMTDEEVENTKQVLDLIRDEMNKKQKGLQSNFISIADEFEREIRAFAHKKIKTGGERLPGFQV